MANRKGPCSELFTGGGAVCADAAATARLGARLAAELSPGSVVSLTGPLGAGKTQFTKGVAEGLGCTGEASSPTFALMHEYAGGRWPVYHFDFYRLESADELTMAGYDDCLETGVTIVEWGEKFPEVLPPDACRLVFEILPDGGRCIRGAS